MKSRLVPVILISVGSLAAILGYLLFSQVVFRTGFPLDDAWIHQTYARNLVDRGEWAYIPGQASAGSTAPLWTLLLSIGYLLNTGTLIWVALLGWLTLGATAWLAFRYLGTVVPEQKWYAWLAAALILLEYHLVWAAVSGMETLLFGLIVLILLAGFESLKLRDFLVGLLLGSAVWIRPDGLLLLLPIGLIVIGEEMRIARIIRRLLIIGGTVLLCLLPYLLFNYLTAGSIWPSTFYAKQAEYASLLDQPLITRLGRLYSQPLIGVGVLLLPGFAYYGFQAVKSRNWYVIAGILWMLGFIGVYVFRLPVIYQHGRYLIPVIPLFVVYGVSGIPAVLDRFSSRTRFVLSRVWFVSLVAVALAFWWWGGRAYAQDVAIIESEMVASAQWIEENTEPGAVIAAHDIGALGYFGDRAILDLAGLISPEVIVIIRDEAALAEFIDHSGVDYLLTFPDWYQLLPQCGQQIYSSEGPFARLFGQENMAVYRWQSPCSLP